MALLAHQLAYYLGLARHTAVAELPWTVLDQVRLHWTVNSNPKRGIVLIFQVLGREWVLYPGCIWG